MKMVKRGRGRPTIGKRIPLGLRVTPQLKSKLDFAAEQTGRSQSQEAELRLERSFEREELLPDVLALAYGKDIAAHLVRLGAEMKARADRKSVPLDLLLTFNIADIRLEKIWEDGERNASDTEEVDEKLIATLEYWFKPFLVPDWRRVGAELRERNDHEFSRIMAELEKPANIQQQEGARSKSESSVTRMNQYLSRRSG
jgi:hypothetical protein